VGYSTIYGEDKLSLKSWCNNAMRRISWANSPFRRQIGKRMNPFVEENRPENHIMDYYRK